MRVACVGKRSVLVGEGNSTTHAWLFSSLEAADEEAASTIGAGAVPGTVRGAAASTDGVGAAGGAATGAVAQGAKSVALIGAHSVAYFELRKN